MKLFNKFILIILIITLSISIWGCDKTANPISNTTFCFDTYITITIYECDGDFEPEQIIEDSFKLCKKFENMLSKSIESSDVYKINNSNGKKLKINLPTYEIISHSLEYSKITDGAFDITVAPLVNLWDVTGDNPSVPKEKDIMTALKNVDYKNIKLDNDLGFSSKNPNIEIDLGAIAKGYIADWLKDSMVDSGIKSAIIDLGGNILTIGTKNEKSGFKIGIKKPFGNEDETTFATVEVNDKSVVTSGIYERYFKEDDKIYHHVINTKTGYPIENDLYSVTIISDSSEDGDALSTSLLSLGFQKSKILLNNLDKDIEAIFITKDYDILLTDGLTIDKNNNISLVLNWYSKKSSQKLFKVKRI